MMIKKSMNSLLKGLMIKMISNKEYKASFYNYCVITENSYIIYNTLYNTLVRLTEDEYLQYKERVPTDDNLMEQLINNGLWVREDVDEKMNYLAFANLSSKYMERPISLTITPTLDCNARCFYCYEAGVKKHSLARENVDKIIAFIQSLNTSKGLKINWFGGEPLMNPEIIDYLIEKLRELNIPFISYLITNGSLLTDHLIEKAYDEWNVRDVQITLDGMQEEYEKRKNYISLNEDIYYKVIYNIKKLADKKIYVHIRINIDTDNIEDVYELVTSLEEMFGKYHNVTFYPAFLTGRKVKINEEDKVSIIKEMLVRLKNPKKLTSNTKLYSFPKIHACMNNDKNSFTIDVNGNVFTCEHQVGRTEKSIGNINDRFDLTERESQCGVLKIDDKCKECIFLPKCMGGCKSNLLYGEDPCFIEKYIIKSYLELL